MGQQIKGVIFGVDNVLVKKGLLAPNAHWLEETGKLVRFLHKNGIEVVVMTNHDWTMGDSTDASKPRTPARDFLQRLWGVPLSWYRCNYGGMPPKQSPEAFAHICTEKKWEPNETVYIGNTDADMQTAVNSKILLLNAQWYEKSMDYGFQFGEPKEVARFIDVFCLREHAWAFRVENDSLSVYTLATFSTMYEPFIEYSNDFLANIKKELGHDEQFWAKYLCSSLYLTGLYQKVNYITSYPRHTQNAYPEVLIEPVTRFAKCFRKNYIPDLIVRHTTAIKSQTHRDEVDHLNQLHTIHLNSKPTNRDNEKYAKCPLGAGKTVLVIDDVCSKGMSFEGARTYLEAAGCSVISVGLLKALKHGYEAIGPVAGISPFKPNKPAAVTRTVNYGYHGHVISDDAAKQLSDRLNRYKGWDWPNDD